MIPSFETRPLPDGGAILFECFACILAVLRITHPIGQKPMSEPTSKTIQETSRKLPIIPHHELSETFADQVGAIMFDGSILKIDFVAVRLGAVMPPAPTTAERHVVARLVLSPGAALDLINQVKQLADQLAQAGLIKTEQGQVTPPAKSN
jgi:hypothetical protein